MGQLCVSRAAGWLEQQGRARGTYSSSLRCAHEYFKALVMSPAPFVCSEPPAVSPSPLNTSGIFAILKRLALR